jgi:hypothetical protein
MIGSYYQELSGVGPGIDVSHYGAPYQGMLGYGVGLSGLGVAAWTGTPSEDPRMVKQYTKVRATYKVNGLGGDRTAAGAVTALLAKARALFPGLSLSKIGDTGWTADHRMGFDVILATATRAGEIKQKFHQAGQQAASAMGGSVALVEGRTSIPSNGFTEADPAAPATPETTATTTPAQDQAAQETGFLTQKVAGLPVWGIGLIGVGVVGGIVFVATRKKSAPPTPNRRRRRARRSSRPRRSSRRARRGR